MDDPAGDIIIHLQTRDGAKRSLTLRPSLGFIKKLNERGLKLVKLLRAFREQEYGLDEIAAILACSSLEPLTVDEAESLIFHTGVASAEVLIPLVQIMSNALNGGRPPKKGAEASDPQ